MEIELGALSPMSFVRAKEGDLLRVKRTLPKHGEYRGTIGAAVEGLLVFKGETKIGMIPREYISRFGIASIGKACRVVKIDSPRKVIAVEISVANSTPIVDESGVTPKASP